MPCTAMLLRLALLAATVVGSQSQLSPSIRGIFANGSAANAVSKQVDAQALGALDSIGGQAGDDTSLASVLDGGSRKDILDGHAFKYNQLASTEAVSQASVDIVTGLTVGAAPCA